MAFIQITLLITLLAATIDINLSEVLDAPFQYAFQPYIAIFGDVFWGMFFGFIATALYVGSERNYIILMGYFVIICIFFAIVLPYALAGILGLFAAFIATTILYKAFVEPRS